MTNKITRETVVEVRKILEDLWAREIPRDLLGTFYAGPPRYGPLCEPYTPKPNYPTNKKS
jgi:hypothetical protein